MSLSRFSVNHPITTIMLTLAILLLGIISVNQISVDLLPNIEYPILVATARYPGAAPEEVERLVTQRLEEAVARMSGLDKMTSTSSEGLAVVQARFAWGKNLDQAALDMREKIDLIKAYLPPDVEDIMVIKADISMRPVMRLDLYGASDTALLTDLARDVVKPALERLDGVASVDIVGAVERRVFVDIDPQKLQSYGLTIAHVISTLRQENLSLPGGDISVGSRKVKIRTLGDFQSLDDIEEMRIPSPLGSAVPLREVASVSAGEDEVQSIARYNGQPSVCLLVTKQSGSNTVRVARLVADALPTVSGSLPAGVELVVSEDQSTFINRSISSAASSAVQGGILAALVLFVFLWDWRSTLVISLSMPVSIIFTFVCMYFSGISMNLMSLGGMALGIGMLVDNSIVVLENIYRHHTELGRPAREAATSGSEEVGMAVTTSTLTNLVVFVPILFTSDLASHLFRQLALVVTYSIGASLLVALTVVPAGAAWLLQLKVDQKRPRGIIGWLRGFIDGLPRSYRNSLGGFIQRPRRAYVVLATCVAVTAGILPLIGREFLPKMDRREISVSISLEKGSKLQATDEIVKAVEKAAASLPETERYAAFCGGSMSTFTVSSGSSESGSVSIKLKEGRDRGRPTEQVGDELKRMVSGIPGAKIQVKSVTGVAGEEDFMGSPVEVTMTGEDYATLRSISRSVTLRLQALPYIRDVDSDIEDSVPELQIKVDRRKAAYSGLSVAYVGTMVKAAVQGETATRYRVNGSEYDVLVRYAGPYRESIPDIENMLLLGTAGQVTPLWQVASIVRESGPTSIRRVNQTRTVAVKAQSSGKDLGGVLAGARKELAALQLPQGYTLEFTGQTQEMMGAFASLGFILVLAVLLDYMILAAQFESLVHPLTVMMTVPLAAVGSVLGLFLTNRTFSVPSLIGLITLAGVVVNNAIVFVDHINQLRKEGMEMSSALLETGATRLRPILMTSLTTIMGLLPLALGIGSGAELQAPLAIVIMGGLMTSTFLTLYVVPVSYAVIENALAAVRTRLRRSHRSISTGAAVLVLVLVGAMVSPECARATSYRFSPEQAVSQALVNHPSLKAADAKIIELTILLGRAQAAANLIPDDAGLPYEDLENSVDARTKYLLPAQAANGLDLAQRYREALAADLRYGTLTAYYTAAKLRQRTTAAKHLEYSLEHQVEIARLMRRQGLAVYNDIYQAEAKHSEATYGHAALKSASQQASLALQKILGLSYEDSVGVDVPEFDSEAYDLETMVAEAIAQRYEVYKAQKDLELAQYDLQLAENYGADSPMQYVQYAQAAIEEAQAMLDYYTREVSFGVRMAYAELAAQESKYYYWCDALTAADEACRLAEARKEEGMATDADVSLAEALVDQAEAMVDEAVCDLEIARAKLEHLCSKGTDASIP